jgi:hypothetical protein
VQRYGKQPLIPPIDRLTFPLILPPFQYGGKPMGTRGTFLQSRPRISRESSERECSGTNDICYSCVNPVSPCQQPTNNKTVTPVKLIAHNKSDGYYHEYITWYYIFASFSVITIIIVKVHIILVITSKQVRLIHNNFQYTCILQYSWDFFSLSDNHAFALWMSKRSLLGPSPRLWISLRSDKGVE